MKFHRQVLIALVAAVVPASALAQQLKPESDPAKLTRVLHFDGTPITARFIADAIADNVGELKVVPFRKVVP